VKRFVRALRASSPAQVRRMEKLAGEQAQIDFGRGAPTWNQGCSKPLEPHAFRIVPPGSRKAYDEVVWHQDTESFRRCLENEFHAFGGVPETPVIDNSKAGVLEADWFDPILGSKRESFVCPDGIAIVPTKSRMSRRNGTFERGFDYVRENRCDPGRIQIARGVHAWIDRKWPSSNRPVTASRPLERDLSSNRH
jgi:transposase